MRSVSRYSRNEGVVDGDASAVRWNVVPTPVEMSVDETRRTVNVQNDGGWVVVQPSTDQLNNEAQYLSGLHSFLIMTRLSVLKYVVAYINFVKYSTVFELM